MRQFIIRRLLRTLLVLWGVSTVVFLVLRLSGDPVALLVSPETPPAEVEQLRQAMGFNEPLWIQYAIYIANVAQGDFGMSMRFGQPATELVIERVRPTLELAALSIGLAIVVAIPLGIVSATRRGTSYDSASMVVALVGQSTPTFFLGLVLILIFSVQFRLLPAGGRGEWFQLILPSLTLAAWAMASIARLTRSAMLEVLTADYIRTARAKGLGNTALLIRHAFKNAAIPVLTVIGLQFGAMLGGAVVVETVFSWPGLGRLIVQAINTRDYPVVQAGVFFVAVGFVVLNTVVDMLYAVVDPRIKYS